MKRISILLITLLISAVHLDAQSMKAVKWQFTSQKVSGNTYALLFTADIGKGWHLYSQHLADGGPVKTSFTFDTPSGYSLVGDVQEISPSIKLKEPLFDNMELIYFENKAVFKQLVKVTGANATVKGTVEYMTCNDRQCLPPDDLPFSFAIDNTSSNSTTAVKKDTVKATARAKDTAVIKTVTSIVDTVKKAAATAASITATANNANDLDNKSIWEVILAGIGAGLVSLLMPCVWPIIPLTVSFFLKQNKDKPGKGRSHALQYGLCIMLIFVFLGILVSLLTNQQELNDLSTNWFFNLLFFTVFVLFGISFIGYFEITLPSSFVNKSEQLSEKGGFIGIFFMAFTLVLVSFSCTLPFIGSLIQFVSDKKGFAKPVVGFLAYGFTLGLPFALFAYFPSFLHKLPKSGGWMNVIKVTFGLLEIAFAFIYLSKVDMAYHWGFLSKEKFLAVWIAIAFILGLYHLGKLRFPHDDENRGSISLAGIVLAIVFFMLAGYFTTGYMGNTLEFYSGFIPDYSEIKHISANSMAVESASATGHAKKYGNLFEAPLGIDMYFDYDEALAMSKKLHKPLFIDFTGHGCVNCRKEEKTVWPDPEVLKRFNNNFVMVALYVDDKTKLPKDEQYHSDVLKKDIKRLGDRFFDIESGKYKQGAQPYYVITDNDGNALLQPKGFTPSVDEYINYLDSGVVLYNKLPKQ